MPDAPIESVDPVVTVVQVTPTPVVQPPVVTPVVQPPKVQEPKVAPKAPEPVVQKVEPNKPVAQEPNKPKTQLGLLILDRIAPKSWTKSRSVQVNNETIFIPVDQPDLTISLTDLKSLTITNYDVNGTVMSTVEVSPQSTKPPYVKAI